MTVPADVKMEGGAPLPLAPLLTQLRPLLADNPAPVYLVGGAVRDALLGRTSHDLDFVVARRAVKLAFKVGDALGAPAYVLDRARDTGRVVLPDDSLTLDFAAFRGPDLVADLADRDFTINALALPATATRAADVIDPTGGRADLAAGLIRPTHDTAVADDPVRALRAARLAAYLGFQLTPSAEAGIRAAAPLMRAVSPERVRDEWVKIVVSASPGAALARLDELGVVAVLWPALAALRDVVQSHPHFEPVLAHTWRVMDWLTAVRAVASGRAAPGAPAELATALAPYQALLTDHLGRPVEGALTGDVLLGLGALFHDVGKGETASVGEDGRIHFYDHDRRGAHIAGDALQRYRFSRAARRAVEAIVAGHMHPLSLAQANNLGRGAVHRFFRRHGPVGLDILLLSLADHLATYDGPGPADKWSAQLGVATRLLGHFADDYAEVVDPAPIINGRDIIAALGVAPGPVVGRLLQAVVEAQAAGEVRTREAALDFVREQYEGRG